MNSADLNKTLADGPLYGRCATRWPLFLVHGMGFKEADRHRYWGQIPEILRQQGAQVYVSRQDAWGSIESNARQLQEALHQILKESRAEKVNIIAHSKGGLDARVLAALPDCTQHIASITTLATPHLGVRGLDWIAPVPAPLKLLAELPIDIVLILLGDDDPSYIRALQGLGAQAMQEFNKQYPVPAGIYLQSYAVVQKRLTSDLMFILTLPLIRALEGPNDGLVAQESTNFGEFKGLVDVGGKAGLSHCDFVDADWPLRPRRKARFDNSAVLGWWVELVENLRLQGF